MKTRVIAVVNQKGGVGKTTVCRTLGAMLRDNGYKVLLIDVDAQQTLSLTLGAVSKVFDESTPSMYHLLTGQIPVEDAILYGDNYDLIRSDYRLYGYTGAPLITIEKAAELESNPKRLYEHVIQNLKRQQNPETDERHNIRRILDGLVKSEAYDYIIFDTNPNLGILTSECLLSNPIVNVLIPVFPEESSRQAVVALNDTIKTILNNDLSQEIRIIGILVSKYENNKISKKYLHYFKKLAQKMDTVLFHTLIPKSIIVSEAMALKQTVFDRRKKAHILDEYHAFYREFLERMKELDQ